MNLNPDSHSTLRVRIGVRMSVQTKCQGIRENIHFLEVEKPQSFVDLEPVASTSFQIERFLVIL